MGGHDFKGDWHLKLSIEVGREGHFQVKIKPMVHNQTQLNRQPLNGVSEQINK